MKKRVTLLALFVSLLTAIGHAETAYTLPQVIRQAEAGWHQSYRAHGRTITVDVTPLLPEAERFPVLYCSWKTDWDLVPQGEQYYPVEIGGQAYVAMNEGFMLIVDKASNEKESVQWFASVDGNTIKAQPYRTYYPPFDENTAYIPANPMTLREITEMTKNVMEKLGIDARLLSKEPNKVGTHGFYVNHDKEKLLAPGIGSFAWEVLLAGIPVISDLQSNVVDPHINVLFQNEDRYGLDAILWNVDREVVQDVPLCGFDKVIKTLEKEIQDGRLRAVFEIKLGYGQFNEDGATEDYRKLPRWDRYYYLKPVWRVHGIWVRNAKSSTGDIVYGDEAGYRDVRNSAHQAFITLDAQTGEILTNTNTGKEVPIEQTYYDGYLSWEDMGGKPE